MGTAQLAMKAVLACLLLGLAVAGAQNATAGNSTAAEEEKPALPKGAQEQNSPSSMASSEDTANSALLNGGNAATASHGLPTKVQGDLVVTGKVASKAIKLDPVDKAAPAVVADVASTQNANGKDASATVSTSTKALTKKLTSKASEISVEGKISVKGKLKYVGGTAAGFLQLEQHDERQWQLVTEENFVDAAVGSVPSGWSRGVVTDACGKMIGGHCSVQNGPLADVSKTFAKLPPHSHVRVVAKYHFIDSWEGETGYAKVDGRVVWADTHDFAEHKQSKNGISMCGSDEVAEHKWGQPVDVTLPHTGGDVTVAFGATLDQNTCDEAFGVTDVSVYVR